MIGRYSLEREIGRGGMGVVYLARDVALDRPVAIKALHVELAGRPDARDRILREARLAARLSHPNIVPVYAVESREDLTFIVMGLVDGESLGARIRRRGPVPPGEAERVLREVAWALSYAHARGITHRDLTADNVLLERDSGRALLADFGLARDTSRDDHSQVVGTPAYLAPEAIRGEPVDGRADLYALGVIGFLALSGRLPFEGETAGAILAKHLVQPAPPLAPLARGASARLIEAVEQCLAKTPDDRPADAATFHALLERAPATVAIAPALRNWFGRWERIKPIYALTTPLIAAQTYLLISGYFNTGRFALLTVALIEAALSLTLIPAGIQLAFEVAELRRLQAAGFSIDDIRTAAPHWRAEVERERRNDRLRPLTNRVIFDITAFLTALLAFNILIVFPSLDFLARLPFSVQNYLSGLFYMSPGLYLWAMIGIGINFAAPGYRLAPAGRFRRLVERFWNSSLGARLARFADVAQSHRLVASETLHRPTEMVLGLAVDDIWAVLPDEARHDLGDVPALAHTLQGSAAELRRLADGLRESERDIAAERPAEAAHLAETRLVIEQRHQAAVRTLEQLRLQLLRLLAQRTRTTELTQHLAAARTLERELVHEIAGHAAVRRLLRQPGRRGRSNTPSPSPQPA